MAGRGGPLAGEGVARRARTARPGCRRCRRRAARPVGSTREPSRRRQLAGPAGGDADRAQEVAVRGRTPRCGRWRCRRRRCRPPGRWRARAGRRADPAFEPKPPHAPRNAELRVELDDAVVDVVGDVHVAGGVERDAVGEAELPGAGAVGAGGASNGAFGVELLDAVVVVVGDEHLGARSRRRRAGRRTARGPLPLVPHAIASPPSRLKRSIAVVAAVGDVDVAARHGDAAAGRLGGVLGGAEVELPEFAAAVAPGGDEVPGGGELLDPVVAGVDDVDVARRRRSRGRRSARTGRARRRRSPTGLEVLPAALNFCTDVAELVGDVDVAGRSDRDRLGEAQHAFGALPDHAVRTAYGQGAGAAPRARFGPRPGRHQPARRLDAGQGGEDEANTQHRCMTTRFGGRVSRSRPSDDRPANVPAHGCRVGPRARARERVRAGLRERPARARLGPTRRGGSAPRGRCRAGGA